MSLNKIDQKQGDFCLFLGGILPFLPIFGPFYECHSTILPPHLRSCRIEAKSKLSNLVARILTKR